MDVMDRIKNTAAASPARIAFQVGREVMTYGELWERSGRLAMRLKGRIMTRKPIPVYGHKSPWMLVCFLACVRAGVPYCPIDTSVPSGRVRMILQALDPELILTPVATAPALEERQHKVLDLDALLTLSAAPSDDSPGGQPDEGWRVKGEDIFYIIFTSGSTGEPKGVQITAACLNHFLEWSCTLTENQDRITCPVFLNQAPFSFDLSVMDLYTCLAMGGKLFCLEKETQSDYRKLLKALGASEANVWVSTPSFADLCLADPGFNQTLLPGLDTFLFCGETLTNRTVKRLMKAFPNAQIYNTYGPTESTVAVTQVPVTGSMAEEIVPLPVGRPKPGTWIRILDETGQEVAEGAYGEIVIYGDTVSPGYFEQPALTAKVFFTENTQPEAGAFPSALVRAYHTGDAGWMKDGMLYYGGRMDLQVKFHGYRIELEDIEANLCRLNGIRQAVVIPGRRAGKITSLNAFVVSGEEVPENAWKDSLKAYLPDYMIPKRIRRIDQIPMTANGKADRRKLEEIAHELL